MAQGPLTVVLVCGQRLWRLPPQLASCTHALVWPWDLESVRAQTSPVLLEGAFLLFTLNEYLSRTAIMVQPLNLAEGAEMSNLDAVHIPLPPLSKGPLLEGECKELDALLAPTSAGVACLLPEFDPGLPCWRPEQSVMVNAVLEQIHQLHL